MRTADLFKQYYFSKPWYVSGTVRFHRLIRESVPANRSILEIGAGPSNATSDYLASLGKVTGLDVDDAVLCNRALSNARVFEGQEFPFHDAAFDICISDYVLEHVQNCGIHFREVARVLRPGGIYVFRTPNLWHYVTLPSRLLPHSVHLRIANKLRNREEAHDPYPTVYGSNTRSAIHKHAMNAGLKISRVEMLEPEPTYGSAHALLFFPMMAYERFVNSSRLWEPIRVNIIGVLQKPA